ncbi:hypothetical protein PGQ11_002326 [Apiospora arundinis]|uniref:Uncharacterized protein n=1 Tax=Apiospora arundinis TaxID=335852 RepID=A0ABR2JI22_9PEZI
MLRPGHTTVYSPADQGLLQGLLQQQAQMLGGMRDMSHELAVLRQEVNQIREGNFRCEQKHTVSEQNENLRLENHDLEIECEKLRQLNQQLKHKNQEYVDILIKSPSDRVLDQDVISSFKDLRTAVYGAVTEICAPKVKEMKPLDSLEHKTILRGLVNKGPCDVSRVMNHICRVITQALVKCIFDLPLFGYFSPTSSAANTLKDVEQHFAETVPMDHLEDVAQWRVATIKCSSYYKTDGNSPTREAEKKVWRRIGPIFQYDKSAESAARMRIRQICNDALELKLLMRKAEDEFQVEEQFCIGKRVAGMADFVVKFGEEPSGIGNLPETVAFAKFGALFKYSNGESSGEPIVLEKAHAVVYAKALK